MIINQEAIEKLASIVPKEELDQQIAQGVQNFSPIDDILDVMDISALSSIMTLAKYANKFSLPSGKDPKQLMTDAWITLRTQDAAFRTLKDNLTKIPGSKITLKEDKNINTAAIDSKNIIHFSPDFLKAAVKYYEVTKPKLNLTERGKILVKDLVEKGYTVPEALAALEILIHEASHFRHGDLALMKMRSSLGMDPLKEQADNIAGDIKINNAIRSAFGFPIKFGLVSNSWKTRTQGEIIEEVYRRLKQQQLDPTQIQQWLDDTHKPENYEDMPEQNTNPQQYAQQIDKRGQEADKEGQQTKPKKPDSKERREERGASGERSGASNLTVKVEPKGGISGPDWKRIIQQIASKLKSIKVTETITKIRKSYLPQVQRTVEKGKKAPVVPGERIDVNRNKKAFVFAIDTSASMQKELPAILGEMVTFVTKRKDNNTDVYIALLGSTTFELIHALDNKRGKVIYSPENEGKEGPIHNLLKAEYGYTDIPKNFIDFVKSFSPPNIGVVLITDQDVVFLVSKDRIKELSKATKNKLAILVPKQDYKSVYKTLNKITRHIATYEVKGANL